MIKLLTITEVKAKLSEIVNAICYKKDEIVITKKGKQVAILIPIEKYNNMAGGKGEGLICARGAVHNMDKEIDEMTHVIYNARDTESSREVVI